MPARALAASVLSSFAVLQFLPPAVHAVVSIRFEEPKAYVDAGESGRDRSRTLATLERQLIRLGDACLKAGDRLELRILDVDLAGEVEWWRADAYDLRVMREGTWPRIGIEYVWRDASGELLGEGREQVTDMNYLRRSHSVSGDTSPLRYEKRMLGDWIERRFCAPQ